MLKFKNKFDIPEAAILKDDSAEDGSHKNQPRGDPKKLIIPKLISYYGSTKYGGNHRRATTEAAKPEIQAVKSDLDPVAKCHETNTWVQQVNHMNSTNDRCRAKFDKKSALMGYLLRGNLASSQISQEMNLRKLKRQTRSMTTRTGADVGHKPSGPWPTEKYLRIVSDPVYDKNVVSDKDKNVVSDPDSFLRPIKNYLEFSKKEKTNKVQSTDIGEPFTQ
jgi:hypothetical protein